MKDFKGFFADSMTGATDLNEISERYEAIKSIYNLIEAYSTAITETGDLAQCEALFQRLDTAQREYREKYFGDKSMTFPVPDALKKQVELWTNTLTT